MSQNESEEQAVETVEPVERPAVQVDAAAPDAEPEPAAEPELGAETAPVEIEIPGFLPLSEQTPEREAWVQGFAAMAPQAGLSSEVAQQMLDAVVDVAAAVQYSTELEYATPEDAAEALEHAYGTETAKDIIGRAQRYTKTLGPAAQEYLERTGLGNDLATLTTLALAETGIFNATPAQAAKVIDEIMAGERYRSLDKRERLLEVAKVSILSRIAHREEKKAPKPTPIADKLVAAARTEVDRELNELAKKNEYTPAERLRFIELAAKLSQ